MKAVFIVYNQAMGDIVMDALDQLQIRGFTQWENVQGRGSKKGDPHMGSHTWPALNTATLCMVEDQQVATLLDVLESIDKKSEMQGMRSFVWNIEQSR